MFNGFVSQSSSRHLINTAVTLTWRDNKREKNTFQIINGLLQLGYRPLCKLCTGLSLEHKPPNNVHQHTVWHVQRKHCMCEHHNNTVEERWRVKCEMSLTSFSLSVRTLISSSYLSSFCEYCKINTKGINKVHVKYLQLLYELLNRPF